MWEKKTTDAHTVNYDNGPDYNHYSPKLIGDETRRNPKDKKCLQVKCKKCKKWVTPDRQQLKRRIGSTEGRVPGDHNFYCSDTCKNSCTLYRFKPHQQTDPRSKLYVPKTDQQQARLCQTNNLKELQCDEQGYNYCERCGDIIDVELHHTLEIAKHGNDAINSAGHILLCPGCHVAMECD